MEDPKRTIFNYLSSNSNYITKDNLRNFFKIFEDVDLSDSELNDMIELFDKDNDGKINFQEFSDGIGSLDITTSAQENFYDYISRNNDFDFEKIKKIYSKYPPDIEMDVNKLANILRDMFDDNNDNKVSKQEFLKNFSKMIDEYISDI